MLINLVVVLINDKCCVVFLDGLVIIFLLFIQETDFYESVSLSLKGKGVGKDGVLEVADGLLNLIGLSKDNTELIQHLTSLVKVGGHLEDGNQ